VKKEKKEGTHKKERSKALGKKVLREIKPDNQGGKKIKDKNTNYLEKGRGWGRGLGLLSEYFERKKDNRNPS